MSGGGGWAQGGGDFGAPPSNPVTPPPPPPSNPAPADANQTVPRPPTSSPYATSGPGPTSSIPGATVPLSTDDRKRTGLIIVAVAVGLLVVGGAAFTLGGVFGTDDSGYTTAQGTEVPTAQEEPPSIEPQVEDELGGDTNVVNPPSPQTGGDSPTPDTSSPITVDLSGNPIIDGWFILISSALKGSAGAASLQGLAASNGGHVVDTDSYQTGLSVDGRSGNLGEKAAVAPNYWPGSGAVAAVIGPFPDRFAAEEMCRARGTALGFCVRQFRALPTAG